MELRGLKRGVDWLKQLMHGMHWVHVRSLPVSAMAKNLIGGVPMEMDITYSPSSLLGMSGVWMPVVETVVKWWRRVA